MTQSTLSRERNLPKGRVGVMGLGHTGWSAVRWLAQQGYEVIVADTRQNPPHGDDLKHQFPAMAHVFGTLPETLFQGVDGLLVSPGVSQQEPLLVFAQAQGIPLWGDIEWGARHMNRSLRRPHILAVTGANGKSTVVTLLGAMARDQGYSVAVAGNIGLPLLDVLGAEPWPEVLVLELSSFQLETLSSLYPHTAVVLNVTEDHMDRYADMRAYAAAKARIYDGCQHPVVNRNNAWVVLAGAMSFGLDEPEEGHWGVLMSAGEAWLARGKQALWRTSELHLLGQHNVANVLAALALGDAVGWDLDKMGQTLRHFAGLPHRVETVAVIRGVTYVDDSKGTNVGATVAALEGMGPPTILIAGGDGKQQNFSPLGAAIETHAKAVLLIGRDGPIIAQAMGQCAVPHYFCATLSEAVAQASRMAQPGDVVLMSPACASFDMFRDYLHRAEVFRQAVAVLQDDRGSA